MSLVLGPLLLGLILCNIERLSRLRIGLGPLGPDQFEDQFDKLAMGLLSILVEIIRPNFSPFLFVVVKVWKDLPGGRQCCVGQLFS